MENKIKVKHEEFYKAKKIAENEFGIDLPNISEWKNLKNSNAWFSKFHFGSNKAFELPFIPNEYLYSKEYVIPINTISSVKGRYKRGVNKYVSMIEKNLDIQPVTFIFRNEKWLMQDGNHRYQAHIVAGKNEIKVIFGYPKNKMII